MIRAEYGNGVVNQLYPQEDFNRYHAENLKYDLDDENLNITILGKQIECKSKVLDVACGEGKFGQLYSQKQVQAWGIDFDPVSVEYAQKSGAFCGVICCDVEKEFEKILELKEKIGSNFDYIVLCDVLEHFINPTQVLENLYNVLQENGKILVSIPNAGNADIFLNLLEGKFNYSYSGILDNTHFHFFTKTSFAQWIDEINKRSVFFSMDCKYLGGTFGITNYLEEVEQKYPLIYQLIQYNPQYQTIQLLFELKKVPQNRFIDIFALRDNNDEVLKKMENSLSDKYSKELDIGIETNERRILKEEINTLRKGWEKCNAELKKTQQKLEAALSGWEECDAELKNTQQNLQAALSGWEECDAELKRTQQNLQAALSGWEECDARLNMAQGDLQKALDGWKRCDDMLNSKTAEADKIK